MKRIVATPEGAGIQADGRRPEYRGILINVATPVTREHERDTYGSVRISGKVASPWRRVVRNRIAFRHDESRGEPSHTLWHAVY